MAGTISITRQPIEQSKGLGSRRVEKVTFTCTADAADGSFPDTSVELHGFIMKVVTNPGATAPQSNYDISILDEHGVDTCATLLNNRHTSNSEQVYPVVGSTPAIPVWVCGTHTLQIANNNVNSAIVVMDIYLKDSL